MKEINRKNPDTKQSRKSTGNKKKTQVIIFSYG